MVKYKIVKTKEFKEQEKRLPKEVKLELNKKLKVLAENPIKGKNIMDILSKPSPEELKQWMGYTKNYTIDLVFEYLSTKDCLNKSGRALAHNFWKKYIEKKDLEKV